MKKIVLFSLALVAIFTSCQGTEGMKSSGDPQVDSVSMAFGELMAYQLKQVKGFEINKSAFDAGFTKSFNAEEVTEADMQAASSYIQNYMMNVVPAKVSSSMTEYVDTKLATNKDLTKTESGIYYQIENAGDLKKMPTAESTVKVNYRGTTIDGKEFDSSYSRNEPLEIPLSGVIKGWTEGMQLIGEGGKIKLYIPSELAYGSNPQSPLANQLLIFEVELLEIMNTPEAK